MAPGPRAVRYICGRLVMVLTSAVAPAWAGSTERVSVSSTGQQGNGGSGGPAISADGRFVAFESEATNLVPGDTNGAEDVFVRDQLKGTTKQVSISSSGEQGNLLSSRP